MLGIESEIVEINKKFKILVTASNNPSKGTIIHLHGLPGSPIDQFENLHNLIATRGYRIISFNYPGLWDEKGSFSIEGSIKRLEILHLHVRKGYGEKIYYFAESFGATIAVYSCLNKLKPSHVFYRAPLPGLQYFLKDERKTKQLIATVTMLISAGIITIDTSFNGLEGIVENIDIDTKFSDLFVRLQENNYEMKHFIITGKNDEIIDYKEIISGFNSAKLDVLENLPHNNISRSQWIEIITKLDIFLQK